MLTRLFIGLFEMFNPDKIDKKKRKKVTALKKLIRESRNIKKEKDEKQMMPGNGAALSTRARVRSSLVSDSGACPRF